MGRVILALEAFGGSAQQVNIRQTTLVCQWRVQDRGPFFPSSKILPKEGFRPGLALPPTPPNSGRWTWLHRLWGFKNRWFCKVLDTYIFLPYWRYLGSS